MPSKGSVSRAEIDHGNTLFHAACSTRLNYVSAEVAISDKQFVKMAEKIEWRGCRRLETEVGSIHHQSLYPRSLSVLALASVELLSRSCSRAGIH